MRCRVETVAFIGGKRVGPGCNSQEVDVDPNAYDPWPDWLVPIEGADQQEGEVKASKGARELAESYDVDIAAVEGSGQDGQVTKPDVQAYIESAVNQQEGEVKASGDNPGADGSEA